eukprot:XP_001699639.1 predicted protein [Chlamydomonas reinhardtii]
MNIRKLIPEKKGMRDKRHVGRLGAPHAGAPAREILQVAIRVTTARQCSHPAAGLASGEGGVQLGLDPGSRCMGPGQKGYAAAAVEKGPNHILAHGIQGLKSAYLLAF